MHKTLFRGKRIDNDEWVEGDLIQMDDRAFIATGWIIEGTTNDFTSFDCDELYEVYPETVGQFTGLHAKRKRVFEGDIIQGYKTEFNPPRKYRKPFVANMHTSLPKAVDEYYSAFEHFTEKVQWEIIGNVHDNPELLEG